MRGFSAGLKTRAGLLHFSTSRGIVIVNPNQSWTNAAAPAVWLETVLVDGAVYHARVQPANRPRHRAGAAGWAGATAQPEASARQAAAWSSIYTGLSLGAPGERPLSLPARRLR